VANEAQFVDLPELGCERPLSPVLQIFALPPSVRAHQRHPKLLGRPPRPRHRVSDPAMNPGAEKSLAKVLIEAAALPALLSLDVGPLRRRPQVHDQRHAHQGSGLSSSQR
jgi:hypothetical protein